MAQTASIVAQKLVDLLNSSATGLGPAISSLAASSGINLAMIPWDHVIQQNVPSVIEERSSAVKYPVVHVYSDRVQNSLGEKFRKFSGKIRAVAEVRASQDRIEGLEDQVRLYADAVTQVLDSNRGSWDQGLHFAGAYEVRFEPVQHGGRNFLQIAKVIFEVDLSV